MRRWKPEEEEGVKRLPAPDFEFWELEALRAFGYTLAAWQAETPVRRARLMAHEQERALREAWMHEQITKRHRKGGGGGGGREERPNAFLAMKQRMGLPT